MATYLSPGVYIEEIASGPQPIAAVSPSVLAIIGTTRRGPVNDPTRVTGWGDYEARFGGAVPGLFTAEAVAGFFENGGPAAYVVRVDPSLGTRWTARNANGDDVFTIDASSPGAWANGLTVSVVPSLNGGGGRPWASMSTTAAGTTIDVVSATGLRIGDTVSTVDGAATATVDTITGNSLGVTVTAGAIGDFAQAQLIIDQNATTVSLATAPNVEVGDIVEVAVPGTPRVHARVTDLTEHPGAHQLDLATAVDLPGGAIAPRLARYRATLNAAGLTQINLGHLDFGTGPQPDPAGMADGMRTYFAGGLIGAWDTDHFELPDTASATGDPARMPTGSVDVEAPILVSTYRETALALDNPTLDDLAARYPWVPDGLRLELFSGGASQATIEKSGTAFTLDAGSLAFVFDTVEFDADGSQDAIVTAPFAPTVGDLVELDASGNADPIVSVDSLGGDRYHLELTAAIATQGESGVLTRFQATTVVPYRFSLVVAENGAQVEAFTNLALPTTHSRYFARDGVVNDVSTLITLVGRDPGDGIDFADVPQRVDRVQNGTTEVATANDLINGVDLLEAEAEPAMLICPDAMTLDDPLLQGAVIGAMVRHAETFRRFVIADTPREPNDQDLVDWRLEHVNSIYAAAYAPHIRILNLDQTAAERFRFVPPSGHVAGVFARTDAERGVFKAPANERVAGIVGLAENYTERRQDLLNPNGVNLIRYFPGRDRRIWGARNATTDTQWRYVNVRRLFNVIETSVERGTQWVVFEPNTASTWLRVRASVENFLNGIWQAGGLAGNSPEEAYRVRVGLGETMTEAQIALGLMIVRVAVAAARPAEFVVFQFTHKQISQ